jgi:energy-coupling factor transporter ATP-binding protein EcfA2
MSERGSLWAKWDLHVHTPESKIFNGYPGDKEQAWKQFLDNLEALPPEFKVIGINDYLFIDGYRRICEERRKGRLKKIELILPVIELRLKMFGGTDSKLSRVNFHIIFSDKLSCDLIESQFLSALNAKYTLSPEHDLLGKWCGIPNKQGLEDLGRLIIETTPESERSKFGSPLIEGFNNINFNIEDVLEILNSPYFHGKYITAVGKTEWWDIKWNDHSIADKKNIINSANLVFIATNTPEDYERAKDALKNAGVNSRLLDCSDAHYLSTSEEKDRIGNCFTWIKGDTTFEGLKHALKEFDDRVYVGLKPQILSRVESEGSRFINSIEIRKRDDSLLSEKWFDAKIDLNPGLVAIIGNKGSGKSALAEVMALLGNFLQEDYYSFLNQQKFRQRGNNKASHFYGKLEWANGKIVTRILSESHESGKPEQVKFIPQNFLEKICNEVPHGEETDFDRELKRVIYSHVDSTERLGAPSLDQLLLIKTKAIEENLGQLRKNLMEINKSIVDLERQVNPLYRETLHSSLKSVLDKLRDLRRARPAELPQPKITDRQEILDEIERKKIELEALSTEIERAKRKLTEVNGNITNLNTVYTRIITLENYYKEFISKNEELAKELGIKLDAIINFSINKGIINTLHKKLLNEKKQIEDNLDINKNDSLPSKRKKLIQHIENLKNKLNAPNQEYQAYLMKLEEWKTNRRKLIGAADQTGTALYYRSKLHELKFVPEKLSVEKEKRRNQTKCIHENILELVKEYKELYHPIQQFIGMHPVNSIIKLTFNVSIVDIGFENGFFDFINRASAGSFYGTIESQKIIADLLAMHDLNNTDSVIDFVEAITERLHKDYRFNQLMPVSIEDQLKKGKTVSDLYDYIYGLTFLKPRYAIEFRGKQLHELSPGEKGTLLLLFYLLVDKSDTPLIIDQPEDNLDNQTIFQILVQCIKEARTRRQIIIVTHNPNLAVVCDADQIIVASMDKENGNVITYTSGSIENPKINRMLIDILEGTSVAFDNRDAKYFVRKQTFH